MITRVMVTLIAASVFLVMSCALYAEDANKDKLGNILLEDEFNQFEARLWPELPDGVTIGDGLLTEKKESGGINFFSESVFQYATLEAKFRLDSSRDDTYYYLGFITVANWTDSMCWAFIQGSTLVLKTRKNGGDFYDVANYTGLKTGEWYTIKIVREPSSIELFVNGQSMGRTTDTKNIPDTAMTLALNLVTKTKEASMDIDWVRVTGHQQKVSPEKDIEEKNVILENANMLYQFSIKKGVSLERIVNKRMKTEYLSADQSSPLFLIVMAGKEVNSLDLPLIDWKTDKEKNAKNIQFKFMDNSMNIEALCNVQIGEGDQAVWSLQISNRSRESLKLKTVFPLIEGIQVGDNIQDNYYFYPFETGWCGGPAYDIRAEYGAHAWMQVMDVFNARTGGGVYTWVKDDQGRFKGLALKKRVDSQSVSRKYYLLWPPASPGEIFRFSEGIGMAVYYPEQSISSMETVSLPDAVVGVHQGDWHEALQTYSDWAHKTWYRPVEVPQWFKNCYNFLAQHPPSYYSKEQKKYVRSEQMSGIEDIFQWAFWEQYIPRDDVSFELQWEKFQSGDYEYNKDRGGLPAFKKEIQSIQSKGARMTVYINHRGVWGETKIGRTHGREWARKDVSGEYNADHLRKPMEGWNECVYESGWQDYLADTCARVIRDTGMDGIYLDETAFPFACYNPEHSHFKKGYIVSPELQTDLMVKVRNAMKKENPEAILMGEHAGSDWLSQFFDGAWAQQFYPGGYQFAVDNLDIYRINFFRFYFPEFKLAEWGTSDLNACKRTFFSGIGICWSGESGDYLGKVGPIFRENGDAFATLHPEPLVDTKQSGVYSNKFPVEKKVVYTIYNRNNHKGHWDILDVEHREGYHFVELFHDNEVNIHSKDSKDVLSLEIGPEEVLCVAQLPKVMQLDKEQGDNIRVTVAGQLQFQRLIAFYEEDRSRYLSVNQKEIVIQNGIAEANVQRLFGGKGKIIFKLFDGEILVDELILDN